MAYLSQVMVKFDLGEDFSMSRHMQHNGELRRGERVFDGCMYFKFSLPY